MKKLLILLFSLLISFNSYGVWFGLTSIEDTTCEDFQKKAKGAKLKNLVGVEFKVLKVSNSREISRTKDKLVCIGDLRLDNGVSNTKLRMELRNEDGKFWYQYKQEINSNYDNQTESSKQTVEDIISGSTNLQNTLSCKEITDKNKHLACYDSLSDGLTSSNVKIIPSITKLAGEKHMFIGGPGKPIYGCIYQIYYTNEDPLTGKSKINIISIGDSKGSATFGVKDFKDFYKGDEKIPKIGDCFAFLTPYAINNLNSEFISFHPVEIYRGEYLVDEKVVKLRLKDKITVDEYFEQGVHYGLEKIELTGIVKGTESNEYWFKIILFSENNKQIYTYYDSDKWKDNDSIKKKLISIENGDSVSLKGYFGGNQGMSSFSIIKILD